MLKLKTFSKHIAFILAYFFYEAGMLYAYTGVWVYFWDILWHLLINLLLFYVNAHVVLTHTNTISSKSKAFFAALALITIEFLAFLFLKYLLAIVYIEFDIKGTNPYQGFPRLLLDTTWRFIYIIGSSFAYWFAMNALRKQRQVDQLEKMRLKDLAARKITEKQIVEIENAFLKSQINSHFLFNTLNFLHSSVHKISEGAGDTIIYLSKIMRYSLDLPFGGRVDLKKELNHIRNLLYINKLMTNGKFYVNLEVTVDRNDLKIAPLVLITLTENLLKHGDLKDKTTPAKITCHAQGTYLTFTISNRKRKSVSPLGHGIGLTNVKKRLDLSYGKKYFLTETNETDYYEMTLHVNLE